MPVLVVVGNDRGEDPVPRHALLGEDLVDVGHVVANHYLPEARAPRVFAVPGLRERVALDELAWSVESARYGAILALLGHSWRVERDGIGEAVEVVVAQLPGGEVGAEGVVERWVRAGRLRGRGVIREGLSPRPGFPRVGAVGGVDSPVGEPVAELGDGQGRVVRVQPVAHAGLQEAGLAGAGDDDEDRRVGLVDGGGLIHEAPRLSAEAFLGLVPGGCGVPGEGGVVGPEVGLALGLGGTIGEPLEVAAVGLAEASDDREAVVESVEAGVAGLFREAEVPADLVGQPRSSDAEACVQSVAAESVEEVAAEGALLIEVGLGVAAAAAGDVVAAHEEVEGVLIGRAWELGAGVGGGSRGEEGGDDRGEHGAGLRCLWKCA